MSYVSVLFGGIENAFGYHLFTCHSLFRMSFNLKFGIFVDRTGSDHDLSSAFSGVSRSVGLFSGGKFEFVALLLTHYFPVKISSHIFYPSTCFLPPLSPTHTQHQHQHQHTHSLDNSGGIHHQQKSNARPDTTTKFLHRVLSVARPSPIEQTRFP